jgi:hypothetical protein
VSIRGKAPIVGIGETTVDRLGSRRVDRSRRRTATGSNIIGCPIETVMIGITVEAVFEQASADVWLPKFKPLR